MSRVYRDLQPPSFKDSELHSILEVMVLAEVGQLAFGPSKMKLLLDRRKLNHQVTGHS